MTSPEQWDADVLMRSFVDVLDEIGDLDHLIEKDDISSRRAADALIDVTISGVPLRLVVEIKRSGHPRDAREAAYQLSRYVTATSHGRSDLPVLVAPSISKAARELLRAEGIGYFDSGGSLYLKANGVLVLIDRPVGKTARKAANALFTGRRALALQAAWAFGDQPFGVNEIAKRAQVSPATASEALTALDRQDWTVSFGSGPSKTRRLINRRAMLDAWTEHQSRLKPQTIKRYYVAGLDVGGLLSRLDDVAEEEDCRYALTGEIAAQIHSPYLSSVSQILCRLEGGRKGEAVLSRLEARPVREGWNLGVIEAGSAADFATATDDRGVWLASPLQTYLDLVRSGDRARTFADHLRTEKLEEAA